MLNDEIVSFSTGYISCIVEKSSCLGSKTSCHDGIVGVVLDFVIGKAFQLLIVCEFGFGAELTMTYNFGLKMEIDRVHEVRSRENFEKQRATKSRKFEKLIQKIRDVERLVELFSLNRLWTNLTIQGSASADAQSRL